MKMKMKNLTRSGKKAILFLGLLLTSLILLPACSEDNNDDEIYDFNNTTILVQVVDEQGTDLLDPQQPGNLTTQEIQAVFKDKTYPLDTTVVPQGRFNMPIWKGLHLTTQGGKHYLAFGEFSPEDDYRQASFVIQWGDGTKDTISFDYYVSWKGNTPTVHHALYQNGESVKELKIVKGKK